MYYISNLTIIASASYLKGPCLFKGLFFICGFIPQFTPHQILDLITWDNTCKEQLRIS